MGKLREAEACYTTEQTTKESAVRRKSPSSLRFRHQGAAAERFSVSQFLCFAQIVCRWSMTMREEIKRLGRDPHRIPAPAFCMRARSMSMFNGFDIEYFDGLG
jgi:hypothetical protein